MLSLFDVSFYADCIFIKLRQIALTISITMLCGAARPIQCFFQVLFNTKSLIIEIAYLTFSKGIALLRQYQMTFKAFVILF